MPHLFGTPGKDPVAGGRLRTVGYGLSTLVPLCVEPRVHDVGNEPHVAGDRLAPRPGRP